MANGTATLPLHGRNANDRLKDSFNSWFWGSITAAALIHFAVLAFWPDMQAADLSITSRELEQVEVIPEVEIPPPPEEIARPAVPVLSTNVNIDENITIQETTFDENPVENLPPPPTDKGVDVSAAPTFTPYDVKPELKNRAEFGRLLERKYPPMLRDAGIGGTVVVHVFIDEAGNVKNTRVQTSSGQPQLDQAAEEVMRGAKFTPALNRDQKVPVWIALPVTFKTM